MTRVTTFDTIIDDLIARYVIVLKNLTGWGVLASGEKAVYPTLGLPEPQEPFPVAHVYLMRQQHNFVQGTGIRQDFNYVTIRILGGPATPGYQFVPETKVYQLLNRVVNELTYRRFLENPLNNNEPFRFIMPSAKLVVEDIGRITAYDYTQQGKFIGIEVPTMVGLEFNVGRLS